MSRVAYFEEGIRLAAVVLGYPKATCVAEDVPVSPDAPPEMVFVLTPHPGALWVCRIPFVEIRSAEDDPTMWLAIVSRALVRAEICRPVPDIRKEYDAEL